MTKKFYVYVLQNPNKKLKSKDKYGLEYEPFYVGKGTGNRSNVHLENVIKYNTAHNSRLWAEINKIRATGKDLIVTRVFESNNESLTYDKESEIVSHYGLRYKDGLLVNASLGKAGGWGGASNPTYDRMDNNTHNFQINNPQVDTPKQKRLKKMILEVETEKDLKDSAWLSRAGYSDYKSLKIGVLRVIKRHNLKYKIIGNKLIKL